MLIMSNSKSDQTVTGAWQTTQEVIKKVPQQAIKITSQSQTNKKSHPGAKSYLQARANFILKRNFQKKLTTEKNT